MDTLIALLRGVNVSGQKPLNMKELLSWLSEAGLHEPKHYIQSGNLVFKSQIKDLNKIADLIRQTIQMKTGYEVPVMVMNPKELEQKVNSHPSLKLPEVELSKVYYTFLFEEPDDDLWLKLRSFEFDGEYWYRAPKLVHFYPLPG